LYYSVAVSPLGGDAGVWATVLSGHQFAREPAFREFLLRKIINGRERRVQKFCQMQKRTREDRLKELAESHSPPPHYRHKIDALSAWQRPASQLQVADCQQHDAVNDWPNNREMRCDLLMWPHLPGPAVRTTAVAIPGQLANPQVLLSIPTGCLLSWRTGQAGELTVYYNRGELLRMRCSTETACQLAARRLAWLGEQETPGACQAIEVTVHRVTAYEASLSFGVQADAFYVRSVDSAALPDVAKNSLGTRAGAANFKRRRPLFAELRDIFLTNRAHALFCPAGAAGSGQGSRRSRPDHGDCRLPGCVSAAQRRSRGFRLAEDQLRREDDWSQLVRSANQFAAAAANSTTSSSSGRGQRRSSSHGAAAASSSRSSSAPASGARAAPSASAPPRSTLKPDGFSGAPKGDCEHQEQRQDELWDWHFIV
uniref:POPLD domain-containing protein n=1 Tax=Macrostomum lignano TaxID=282301 RepID=A0A1I8FGZ4_9PLAT